jgi:hypothetical protein
LWKSAAEARRPSFQRLAVQIVFRSNSRHGIGLKGFAGLRKVLYRTLVIRNTKLVAGEVIFRLDLRNLWGKTKDTFQFPPIMLRGTLPQDKTGSVSRSFEFAAWLPEPARFEIDLAFIHAFVFRSLRVGKNKGQTSVEIDGEIELKKWDTGINSFPFSIDPGQDDAGKPLNKIQFAEFSHPGA